MILSVYQDELGYIRGQFGRWAVLGQNRKLDGVTRVWTFLGFGFVWRTVRRQDGRLVIDQKGNRLSLELIAGRFRVLDLWRGRKPRIW